MPLCGNIAGKVRIWKRKTDYILIRMQNPGPPINALIFIFYYFKPQDTGAQGYHLAQNGDEN